MYLRNVNCFREEKNAHKIIHIGDKTYSCENCGKDFRQIFNLNAHIGAFHYTFKMFKL